MSKIKVYNQTRTNIDLYKNTLLDVFNKNNIDDSFSIIFVSKKEIRRLNKQFRKINKVTDVLTFVNDESNYLGDIFICLKQAFKQARRYKHSKIREISFLAVHGYLHLTGYDHKTLNEAKKMNIKTEQILNKANIKRG